MKKNLIYKLILLTILLGIVVVIFSFGKKQNVNVYTTIWQFQSIDTMKFSRDLAQEKLESTSFDIVINTQIKNIAQTGANYVAIDTPYDEKFYPMLQRWVTTARKYKLNVWFRGNWSGWEGWFNYPKIDRQTHIENTKQFILKHKDIFVNGDIFTACPECENGGPGDPRVTGDIKGYRQFLIDEYLVTKSTFKQIGKNVASNYDSMNGDVATTIMDKETTKALDGIVTIDHYVATPEQLVAKVHQIALASGGKVVLGEFGAPIPDIHGDMTQNQQATWITDTLKLLENSKDIVGMNYWTNQGSTTALWNDDGSEKKAVSTIKNFYSTRLISSVYK
jgi:hypothetical protein